jgi:hypothetical protein
LATVDDVESHELPLLQAVVVSHRSKIDASLLAYKQQPLIEALNDALQQLPSANNDLSTLLADAQARYEATLPDDDPSLDFDDDNSNDTQDNNDTNNSGRASGVDALVLGPKLNIDKGCELRIQFAGNQQTPAAKLSHRVAFTTPIET